ncbi:hypothetical protein [uncultured Roseivirga sp.]|uniref:hypothetical protein n=1 Tax=uncultured Roseivirga sp. TaxID=543088 RepID=UPI002584E3ED|nr:hypothetical protein [uncultured Roseivirga sp.]
MVKILHCVQNDLDGNASVTAIQSGEKRLMRTIILRINPTSTPALKGERMKISN